MPKIKTMKQIFITKEQALNCLNKDKKIHTFTQHNFTLIGTDVSIKRIKEIFNDA